MFCDVCAACFYVFFSNHLSILYLYNMSTTYIDQTVPPPTDHQCSKKSDSHPMGLPKVDIFLWPT